MMIRSMPPASAHLAERPVPAPAPMIGRPCGDLAPAAASRARRRGSRSPPSCDQLVEPVRHRVGELGIVDVGVELVHLDAGRRRLAQRVEAGPRRLPGRGTAGPRPSIGETPRSGHEQRRPAPCAPRACAAIAAAELARTPRASCASASRSGCARRGCGPRTAAGTVSRGPKLTMSSAPGETTCGSRARRPPRAGPGRPTARRRRDRRASSVVVTSSTPAR